MALRRKKTTTRDGATETGATAEETTQPNGTDEQGARDGAMGKDSTLKTRVKDLPDGVTQYWRGGVAHTRDWQAWPVDAFTPEQLEKIKADPRIQMTETEIQKTDSDDRGRKTEDRGRKTKDGE